MSLKQSKILAIFLVVGILISVTAARVYLYRSDGHKIQSQKHIPGKFETAQQSNRDATKSRPDLTSSQQKQPHAIDNGSDLKDSLPTTSDAALAPIPLPSLSIEPGEKDWYFEFMTEALEDDFPELNLSEIEKIELFEAIWKIRESFEQLRSLDRSAEHADVMHQLEFERDTAIADFEDIIGMSFYEFMLRTPPSEGGIDYD